MIEHKYLVISRTVQNVHTYAPNDVQLVIKSYMYKPFF
jgi:hypothetical protein